MYLTSPRILTPRLSPSRIWTPSRRIVRPKRTGRAYCRRCGGAIFRRLPILNMAAVEGKAQMDADGKVYIDSDGKLVTDSATVETCCCEGEVGDDCESCTGSTPAQVTVSLSGHTSCIGSCRNDAGFAPSWRWTGSLPTGPWDLPQLPGEPCNYRLDVATTAISLSVWGGNASCSGSPDASGTSTSIEIHVALNNLTPFGPTVVFWVNLSPTVAGWSPIMFYAAEDFSLPFDCMGLSESFTNQVTSCGGGSFFGPPRHGGTALVTS